MTEEEIPDYNLFMRCEKLNEKALTDLNKAYYFRNCRPEELEIWKAFPFDTEEVPTEYEGFMNQFIQEVYGDKMDTFYKNTLFVCNQVDQPLATCSHWKAYGKINTIHWLKTLKAYEGKGIGRALFSKIMSGFKKRDYPIYLHTQPGSFRAIKLYTDFGFKLLKGGPIGTRSNDLEKCLPILRTFMPTDAFSSLKIEETPNRLIKAVEDETIIQF